MSTEPTLISVREAARTLGVHDNTVRRYADRGLVRTVRLPSGVRRLVREDIDALAPRVSDQAHGAKRSGSVDDLAAPEIWASDEEVEAFLAMTYAERDRDR